MTLREERVLFTKLLGQLINFAFSQGWELAIDEARVITPRAAFKLGTQEKILVTDAVHKHNSKHHSGLAVDLNLYIDGKWISDGGHPTWTVLGEFWESLDPATTWGGRFAKRDSNHFSLNEG